MRIHNRRRWCFAVAAGLPLMMVFLSGPAATWLQSRPSWADTETHVDAVYLVCGARAQARRITALNEWLERNSESQKSKVEIAPSDSSVSDFKIRISNSPRILIGNDPQKSLWCREHQTNHTRTGWAVEKLGSRWGSTRENGHLADSESQISDLPITVVPGHFQNTDGEMIALGSYLKAHPEIQSIALVTSRFHVRRCLQRFHNHTDRALTVQIIPGVPWWENRAPWIVAGELLKMIRDSLHLSHILTRPEHAGEESDDLGEW
jgi:hypothetical protein